MASFDGTQYADITAGNFLNPTEIGGRVRVAYFDIPAITGLAQNDTVNLTKLPIGARVIGGRLDHGAYGASVTLSIGYTGSTAKFLSAADISGAGQKDLANTLALNMGFKLTASLTIFATFAGANPSDTAVLNGYLLYVVD